MASPTRAQAIVFSIFFLKRSVTFGAAALLSLLVGCQTLDNTHSPSSTTQSQSSSKKRPSWIPGISKAEKAPDDVWERIRLGYQLQDHIESNPRIEQQRLNFASRPSFMEVVSERGEPYLHHVVESLAEREMPLEIALLPAIESSYNPQAYSRAHASGLWQFIPSTGRHFNLRQTSWYDGRRDILASTTAAMDYLQKLHSMFDGDWLLALAAYNAGEGTVGRAIERNRQQGLPTDYWSLPLPKETQEYVPKLLALSQIVLTPEQYGVDLNPVANQPYFEQVSLDKRVDLAQVAKLADLDAKELYQLNPAFKRHVTIDGPQHLLVPADKAQQVSERLAELEEAKLTPVKPYTVRKGDNLGSIARRHKLSVAQIKQANNLRSDALRVGQRLILTGVDTSTVPAQAQAQAQAQEHTAKVASRPQVNGHYQVKAGDTLWSIARAHNVTVEQLKQQNSLANGTLKAGQRLTLNTPSVTSGKPKQPAATQYKVRSGDSLYAIAKRFNIDLSSLQRWNPSSGSLKPGQLITLYLPN